MDTREFNRLMKYAHTNDDEFGILGQVYNRQVPMPYFDPSKIVFTKLRNFDHNTWAVRENIDRKVVWEDLEFIIPGEQFVWNTVGNSPALEKDLLVTSSITLNDHLWPCEYVFNSWHLVRTSEVNSKVFVENKIVRPYFADILLGNSKPHRFLFYDLLKENNQLDNNIINLFGIYKTPFIDQGKDFIDLYFTKGLEFNEQGNYYNTASKSDMQGNAPSQYISKHINENSWISVVAETLDDNRIFFPTEKTGKALISNKPFIMLSSKNFLKHLRSIGFKTFHPVIDESYDEIDNLQERIKAAFNSFMELQKQDPITVRQKLKEQLDHNEKCIRDKEWLTRSARTVLDRLATPV